MAQPQVFINDYSEKSVVLRSNPPEFFKEYSTYLTQLSGKFNRNLRSADGTSKEPGWIFPKSKEQELRTLTSQILSGQVQPAPRQYGQQAAATPAPSPLGSLLMGTADQITVFQPKVGDKVKFNWEGGSAEADVIERVGNDFKIRLPDGQVATIHAGWHIPGFTMNHSITQF